jgi:folate-binding protein YgfZ
MLQGMEMLALHELHHGLGAHFGELNGTEVVAQYGSVSAEHASLAKTAAVLDLGFRSRICLVGADRARFLHGQITNEVKALRVGEGCYAALITAKGKLESDLNLYCLKEELLLDFEPGLARAISERLEKYIIADDVQMVDVSNAYGLLSVQGPKAAEVILGLGLVSKLSGRRFSFVSMTDSNLGEVYLAKNPRLETEGFDLFVPNPALGAVADKLIAAAKSVGGGPAGWDAFETARIEKAIPRFGVDMDTSNIPLEAGLEERAISFKKGCYIGQEVISRIRTYGQVAKALRSLEISPELKHLPAKGDKLFQGEKEVGYLTSATRSLARPGVPALGYVRKEANQVGTELHLRNAEGDFVVRITGLPFHPLE